MDIFKSIFSAPETISKTVDAVIKSGDALVFTEEEQSVASQKKLDWLLKFHQASSGSNIARRWLAVMTVGTFLLLILATALMIGFDVGNHSELTAFIAESLVSPVMMIIGFYFSVAALGAYKK